MVLSTFALLLCFPQVFFFRLHLNEQLLDLYFPDRNTISLFATVPEATDEEMLSEAYRLRNKAIGYRIGSEKAKAM